MDFFSRHLVFHASLVLLIGLLFGAPYARSIKRNDPPHIVNAWRVAHLSIPIGATLMFAVAALLPFYKVGDLTKWLIVGSLIVSSYSFGISLPIAAVTGHRGLSSDGKGWARLVYAGNLTGAVTSLIAAGLLVFAGAVSL
jgi:hypothetical protein